MVRKFLLLSFLFVASSWITVGAKEESVNIPNENHGPIHGLNAGDHSKDTELESTIDLVEVIEALKDAAVTAESNTNKNNEATEGNKEQAFAQQEADVPDKKAAATVPPKLPDPEEIVGNPQKVRQGNAKHVEDDPNGALFLTVTIAAGLAGFVGLMMAGVCYYKYRSRSKAATEVGYPAYGETGPNKERVPSPGDRKLAQSAQMYHYQHQKQQMIAMEKANGDMKHDASDDESEEDNIEGDYTVYECPGLAPTGEMEVKNPLFRGDDTPVNPSQPETDTDHSHVTMPNGEEQ